MKNIKIIIFASISFLLYGCIMDPELENNQNQNEILSFSNYAKILSDATSEGTVLIQSNLSFVNLTDNNNIDISERPSSNKRLSFFSENNQLIDIIGSIDQNLNNSLYGKKIKYSVDNNTTKELYIPNLIKPIFNKTKVSPNSEITWNPDPLNKNGVAIWVYYMPTIQYFSIMESNRHYIVEGIVVPDNGKYTITNELLSRFPNGSTVELSIGRAAFDINNNYPSLVAYTTRTLTAEISK